MNKRKSVVYGVFLVSILLVSMTFVSASWLGDLFKSKDNPNLEGELNSAAPAKLKILDASAPIVVYVGNVSGPSALIGTDEIVLQSRLDNSLNFGAGNANVTIWFLAQQGVGGPGNLGTLNIGTPSVYFNYTGYPVRNGVNCVDRGTVNCGALCSGTARNYSCVVLMRYFDGPYAWVINATVLDTTTGKIGSNTSNVVNVKTLTFATVNTNYLNWTNPPLTIAAGLNRFSDNNLSLTNDGNTVFNTLYVNATNLTGVGDPTKIILSNRFFTTSTYAAACTGAALINNSKVLVSGFTLNPTTTETLSSKEAYTCINDLTGLGLDNRDYASNRDWNVDIN